MGGSRRRLKKTQAKVRVGVQKRKRDVKSVVPLELTEGRPQVLKRLQQTLSWAQKETLSTNYAENRLVMDPNIDHRSNKKGYRIRSKEEREEGAAEPAQGEAETFSDDDELRAGCNLERRTGKAPPPRLTSTQSKIVEELLRKHGDNVQAMVLDTKLNKMQHSAGQLEKLFAGHRHWAAHPNARHDFRGPNKPYKRL